MIKKISILTFIFFFVFVNNAIGHTGLESSSPQEDEIVTEELKEIILTFDTKVELSSTFEVKNSNGNSIPVENISLKNNELLGSLSNPLENGDYQVIWKIIGADGHPVEGGFSFSVDVPGTDNPALEQQKTEHKEPGQAEEKNAEMSNQSGADAPDQSNEVVEQNNMPSYVIPSIIGVLIILVIGSFLWLMRRKK